MTPDPSGSGSRPAAQTAEFTNKPENASTGTKDGLPENQAPDQGVGRTDIHHRSVARSEPAAESGSLRKTADTPDKDTLRKQLTEILSQFSDQSPAPGESAKEYQIRLEKMRPYRTEVFLEKLLKESVDIQSSDYFVEASEPLRCGILLCEALNRKRLNDPDGSNQLIERLLEEYPEQLPDLLELLSLCRKFAFTPKAPELEDLSEYFYALANKLSFPPALWLIIRESVRPGTRLFSPGLIPELLDCNADEHRNLCFSIGTFALQPDEADIIYRSVNAQNITSYHQMLWLLSGSLRAVDNTPWPVSADSFSRELQEKMAYSFITATSALAVKGTIDSDTEVSESAQELLDSVEGLSISQGRALLRKWTGYDQLHAAEDNPELSDYQRSLVGLMLAWSIKHEYIAGTGSALRCAAKLASVADRNVFPLLLLDAAKIYANFAQYSKATACLDKLSLQPLSAAQKNTVAHLRDAYTSKIEDSPETGASSKPDEDWLKGLIPDTTKTKSGAKGGKKKALKKTSAKKAPSKSRASKPRLSSTQRPVAQPAASEDTPPDSAITGRALPDYELEKTSTSIPERPEMHAGLPGQGWLPDTEPAVYRFIAQLNKHRRNEDLGEAAMFISRSLQQNRRAPLYGRVCEEAAWFYIHQMDSGLNIAFTLDADKGSSRKGLGKLAGDWLDQTEACYFQTGEGCGNNPEKLEALINQAYLNHPDWFSDPEYAKRITGLCSSRGHLCSNLVQQGTGIRTNRKKYPMFYHLKNRVEQLHLAARNT